ncbi:PREDICTED: trichohyalin-like [Atta cephalotes]|uniref:Uncharacterized protein n=1 Tax=Atta cephalotes TaxID=12957 RepID=A0A158NW13_ATTCE|nr:PREDICTED: trichohyalin-like [Atta cephalotes]
MQPRVTVVLATVWLTVAVLVGGAVTLRLSHDQYSPVSPRRHARVQRDRAGVWRDHDPVEDQPLDLWIGSRRSISAEESGALSRNVKYTERDFEGFLKDIVSSKRMYPFSGWQRRLPNIAGAEFAADKVDYGYEMPKTLSREAKVSPSDLLDDPFVADDTFQDQGPGSMEIYKLDLSKEKTLLIATTPSTNLLSRNKSKAPKKTGHLNSKTKTEIKSITSANVNRKQSNFFEEQLTETPLINKDAFDVGGVPELQVGCEGLEASLLSHKTKRSIDTPDKEKGEVPVPSVLLNVSPVSLDLDDVLSYDEEEYEEMDELLKLKKLETTTKRNKPNRGDMDASHLNSDHLDEFRRPEKLPERGDLGGSIPINSSELITNQKTKRSLTDLEIKNYTEAKPKREMILLDGDNGASRNHGRQLLWLAEANIEGFADSRSERKRTRRSIDWGFGEDEGVVSSDELQTVNERRRQHQMRYHQDTSIKRREHHGLNTDIDNVRQKYEKILEQKRREEEYLRQMQQANQKLPNRREEEEKKKRDELRRRQYEEYYKRMNVTTHIDNEDMRRQMEERRRQEMQETVRRNEEELRRREEEEQARKQEQYRWQQEAQRKRDEEARRRQDSMRNPSENVRRISENRRKEWLEKKRQEDEDERRRQQPLNLMRTEHSVSHPNDIRQRDRDEKRRQQEERQREQKLREYITRNRPINVNHADQRSKEEKRHYRLEEHQDPRMNMSRNDEEYYRRLKEQRKRQEEERKLQDYIRRNQPVNVPSRDNQSTTTGRNWFEERRLIEEARRRDRYPDPGVRRDHGPSAPTYIDPRSSPEEVRRRQQEMARRLEEERRQRYEAKERRKELARRQWEEEEERRLWQQRMREEAARREEEARREQSRRYEENRQQLEVARIQAERRRQEIFKQRSKNEIGRTKQLETRLIYHQNPRLLAEHRRRQDSRPIPSNLMRAEEARRATAERERQRLEAERRQQEESRMREHRQKETDQWRRQELARLNSLPVSARIIVRPGGSSPTTPVSPSVISRGGFNNEIDFIGINPHRDGVQVAQFPVPPTPKPPAQSPAPCVWAVVHCCSSNNNRLVKCFESLGCPGINWDPNPCRGPVADAARTEVLKFYANS